MSRTSDVNLFGKIIQYKLPLTDLNRFRALHDNLSSYLSNGGEANPWEFVKLYPQIYWDEKKGTWNNMGFDELKQYANIEIRDHFGEFAVKSLQLIPSSLMDTTLFNILKPPSESILSGFFNILSLAYGKCQILFFVILPAFPLSVIIFLRKRNLQNTVLLLLGIVSVYHILTAVFFSFGEYGRLMVPAQPEMYLFSFYWWYKTFQSLFSLSKKIFLEKK